MLEWLCCRRPGFAEILSELVHMRVQLGGVTDPVKVRPPAPHSQNDLNSGPHGGAGPMYAAQARGGQAGQGGQGAGYDPRIMPADLEPGSTITSTMAGGVCGFMPVAAPLPMIRRQWSTGRDSRQSGGQRNSVSRQYVLVSRACRASF